MPFKLHTAKGRKGEKYQRAATTERGGLKGWNGDASPGALPFGEFSELKNYRKITPGQIDVRTGYKTFPLPGNFTPLAETEYRIDEDFRDVTFYSGAGNLSVNFLNALDGTSIQKKLITGGITADTKVYAWQFNTYLVYTVYGKGVFAMQPADLALSAWNDPVALGKVLATAPRQIRFPDTITGDLIVYDESHVGIQQIRPGANINAIEINQNFSIGEKEPNKIPVDLGASYFAPDTAITDTQFTGTLKSPVTKTIADTKLFGRWTFGKDDGALPDFLPAVPRDKSAADHLRTNACGYKIVFVHQDTDVKGQRFTHRSNPSVDFWVQDSIYIPPTTLYQPQGTWDTADNHFHFPHYLFPSQSPSNNIWQVWPDGFDYEEQLLRIPSGEEVQKLQNLYKPYFHDSGSGGTGTNDPYLGAALWLLWDPKADADMHWNAPYKVEMPVSELKHAPMTIFNWSDFDLPGDVVAIEIYRTAYAQPDDKDNATLSPEFQPYRYGLVGSIKKDGTFTDDVAIPDFGTSPDRYIGFLTDQLSGACMTIYNEDHLVLGDTITGYYVNAPAMVQVVNTAGTPVGSGQAFAYEETGVGGGYNKSHLIVDAANPLPDNLPQQAFFLQYIDSDGNVSDLAPVAIDISAATGEFMNIAIVPPRGYAPNISSIALWLGIYFGGERHYKQIASTNLPTTLLVGKVNADPFVAMPSKTIVNSIDRGAICWCEPQDIFNWPQENFLLIHQTSPVTGFGVTIGMLTVFCDRATWATDLGSRTEEKSRAVGLISRWANTTVEKIPFFLSQFGLYVSDPSGVRKFDTDVESVLLEYLIEEIPGVEQLTNARRASMKWLGQRDELWLWMPASTDLGTYPNKGTLPARCFVYKIANMHLVASSEFEIASPNPTGRVIFNEHADGKLFCAYNHYVDTGDERITSLVVQDNDAGSDWTGKAFWEMMLGLDVPEIKKVLRAVMMTAEVHAKLSRITGLPRTDGTRSVIHGSIDENASVKELTIRGNGSVQQIYFNCSGSVYDTYGYVPIVRGITEPDADGNHRATFHSVEVLFFSKHKHPL